MTARLVWRLSCRRNLHWIRRKEWQTKPSAFLSDQPWVEKYITYVGAKSPVTTGSLNEALLPTEAWNQVGITVILQEKDDRDKLSTEYLEPIRRGIEQQLLDEAGIQIYLTHVGGNPEAADPIQINVIGPDYGVLQELSASVQSHLRQQVGAEGVRDNLGAPLREVRFEFLPEMMNFHNLDGNQCRFPDPYGNGKR